ncbi:hypothetical protein AiwAL_09345 [Acidiphilium sp. AL]|uniref:hypothetical protein n=1 Tax=Acidiphilium sp. AL TaxID=2871704 RepID=UPI0021CB46DD|nr:hypothetical protein [Acidiphilium sp. AL]MCU4160315.1 hypothetical protein [Acidiphilium sp. AL]
MTTKRTLMAALTAATLMTTGSAMAAQPQPTRIAQIAPQMENMASSSGIAVVTAARSGTAVSFGTPATSGSPQWVQAGHDAYPAFAPLAHK